MPRNTGVEKAIAFTQFSVALTCCWPLPSTATKNQVLRFKILRSAMLLNAFVLLVPLLYAVHVYRDDAGNMCRAALLGLAVLQNLVQSCLCIAQYERYQRLIEEMIFCCEKASSYEKHVYQRYVDKYSVFYGIIAVWFYMTGFIVILGTLFISDPFPTNAEYPVAVNFEPVRSIVFVHQAFVGMQCAAHMAISVFCALLLLFASARFEILQLELRDVKDVDSLIMCIKKYHRVKWYATEVIHAVRSIALITVVICGVATVFSGITIIGRQPFTVKIQFLSLASIALLKVFMCTWPADHLMDISESAMRSAYESEWYRHSLRLQKYILIALIPQAPVVLSVRFVIPTLSLNYYCSFVSNVFSLFTVLRVTMIRDEDDY
ncbi:uncharacterized protein LOC143430661 [Xylocopa sonorina]|uniref:uncharacterized protein LOC143430661 n=1 Tax=Xylocopa sonorina TaxID=1818115 RepID=UPI00403AF5C6